MSYHFQDRGGSNATFECNLFCMQCEATTLLGKQCANRTCKFLPYCTQHTKSILGVAVQKSSIEEAGDGLFAVRNFEAGDVISVYYGERMTEKAFNSRYGGKAGPYGLESSAPGRMVMDAACFRSPGAYANDKSGRKERRPREDEYNAKYVQVNVKKIDKVHGKGIGTEAGSLMCIVATQRIIASPQNRVEIFVNYGQAYWDAAHDYTSRTKKHRSSGARQLSDDEDDLAPPHSIKPKPKRSWGSKKRKKSTKKKSGKASKKGSKKSSAKSPKKSRRHK